MGKIIREIFVVNFLIDFSFCFFASPFYAESDAIFFLRIRNRSFANADVLTFDTRENIDRTAFDPQKPIIFQVHGFDFSISSIEESLKKINLHQLITRHDYTDYFHSALLNKYDVNLFFIDWSKGAKTLHYSIAKNRVYDVASVLGSFMIFLQEKYKIDLSKVTCIGFSLGAHICGVAGSIYLEGKKMGKVIGLDPAGPLFDINAPDFRISPNSAEYVECIHTGYFFGIRAPVCQADFFVNKGSHQPGCTNIFGVDSVVCSHYRAIWYYIEALKNPEAFYGKSCTDFKNVLSGTCSGNDGEFMGNDKNSDKKVKGIFQVFTNRMSSFGRGKN